MSESTRILLSRDKTQGKFVEIQSQTSDTNPNTLERALSGKLPDEFVHVTVSLVDPAPKFLQAVADAKNQAERDGAVTRRQQQLLPSQQQVSSRLSALGAKSVGYRWLTNDVDVEIPVRNAMRIAAIPGVIGVHADQEGGGPKATYDGLDVRYWTGIENMIDSGYASQSFSRTGNAQPLKIGFMEFSAHGEDTQPEHRHYAFRNGSGVSRVTNNWNCKVNPCAPVPGSWAYNHAHATVVAAAAAADLELGQDPTQTDPWERLRRSGMAPNANIAFYLGNSCAHVARALNRAAADGVDILNMSMGYGGPFCDRSYDCSNINATIRAAADAGVLLVVAAGNVTNGQTFCSIDHPVYRPEVLGVGNLNSDDYTRPYNLLLPAPASAAGGMVVRTHNSSTNRFQSGLALMAPGVFSVLATTGSWWSYSDVVGGTSIAAPVVAGSAANMRQALNFLSSTGGFGWHNGNNTRLLFTTMLAMGDGTTGLGAFNYRNMSYQTGAGRIRMHWPQSPGGITAPTGWGGRSFTINNNQTAKWNVGVGPLPMGVTVWKSAVTWFENDLNKIADIDVFLVDTCPPGGGEVILMRQDDYDTRNRLAFKNDPYYVGKCLQMKVHGYNVPVGGRVVYAVDYFSGGDASWY